MALSIVSWLFISFAGPSGFLGGIYVPQDRAATLQLNAPAFYNVRVPQTAITSILVTVVAEDMLPAPEFRNQLLSGSDLRKIVSARVDPPMADWYDDLFFETPPFSINPFPSDLDFGSKKSPPPPEIRCSECKTPVIWDETSRNYIHSGYPKDCVTCSCYGRSVTYVEYKK